MVPVDPAMRLARRHDGGARRRCRAAGERDEHPPRPAPPRSGAPVTDAAVKAVGADVYDDAGDRDNAGRVSRVIDGNPDTGWKTFNYKQQFPALKPGVGIITGIHSRRRAASARPPAPARRRAVPRPAGGGRDPGRRRGRRVEHLLHQVVGELVVALGDAPAAARRGGPGTAGAATAGRAGRASRRPTAGSTVAPSTAPARSSSSGRRPDPAQPGQHRVPAATRGGPRVARGQRPQRLHDEQRDGPGSGAGWSRPARRCPALGGQLGSPPRPAAGRDPAAALTSASAVERASHLPRRGWWRPPAAGRRSARRAR